LNAEAVKEKSGGTQRLATDMSLSASAETSFS
jgi:hypothetical protein